MTFSSFPLGGFGSSGSSQENLRYLVARNHVIGFVLDKAIVPVPHLWMVDGLLNSVSEKFA